MKRARVCGKICHNAKREKCGCWCGGLFHGGKAEAAREAFKNVWGTEPTAERELSRGWDDAIAAAKAVAS